MKDRVEAPKGLIQTASDRYDDFYTDLRRQGAPSLQAHVDALWWALEEAACNLAWTLECSTLLRDVTLERRQTAGDLA